MLLNEITRKGVSEALQNPGRIDEHKVSAQQARRLLDRLVGYKISPLLWQNVQGGLSAGRVQSVALRIICDREQAIKAFVPREYWSINATMAADPEKPFKAYLHAIEGKKANIPHRGRGRAHRDRPAWCEIHGRQGPKDGPAAPTRPAVYHQHPAARRRFASCASPPSAPCGWRSGSTRACPSATTARPA